MNHRQLTIVLNELWFKMNRNNLNCAKTNYIINEKIDSKCTCSIGF